MAGAASAAYQSGAAGKTGGAAVAGGVANVAKGAANGATSPLRKAASTFRDNFALGRAAASNFTNAPSAPATGGESAAPAWVKAMKRRQAMTHGATSAANTLKAGDSHSGGAGPDISEKD
jgi:type IV secretion system protein TrbL